MFPLTLQTFDILEVGEWCRDYSLQGPARRTAAQAFGIALYQAWQAWQWEDAVQYGTQAEAAASTALWLLICSSLLGLRVADNFPVIDYREWDERVSPRVWLDLLGEAQQHVHYATCCDYGERNARFRPSSCGNLLAHMIRGIVSNVKAPYRYDGFYDASHILLQGDRRGLP